MDEVHFQPRQRQVFRYHNGKEIVSADPLMLRGQLRLAAIQQGTSVDKLIDSANGVDMENATDIQVAEGWQAAFLLSEIVTAIFSLKDVDVAHALGVLHAFHEYLEKKNPPSASPPTSTPPTASTSAIPPTTATSSV